MGTAKQNQVGGGWGRMRAGGGGKAAIATTPRHPRDLCDTQKPAKISGVTATAWRFGPDDLVKTNKVIINCKKNMERAFKSFEKFKIALLEAELQLPKRQLKSQNYTSLNRS
jgi:hypothetical protein